MNYKQALKIYKETNKRLNAYYLVSSTTSFDQYTIAPSKATNHRNNLLSLFSGEIYSIISNKDYIDAVTFLSKEKLDETFKREIFLTKKSLDNIIKFTKEEEVKYSLSQLNGFNAWQKAKQNNKYSLFESFLKDNYEIAKERAHRKNKRIAPYNVCLDDFEEGMTIKDYDKFFNMIKKELTPLISKINKKQEEVDSSFLYKYYPKDKQEKFAKILLSFLNFDSSWGYMGVSEHPFTNGLSKNDVRITTSYDEYNVASSIFSIIHEVGHAYYEHQIYDKYDGTIIASAISSGMHESQSRLLENYIGRRESFWKTLYPKLQELFPENLKDVSLKKFVRAINASKSSLIRTEADELTYSLHVLIRYEIEKGIFQNKISTKDLNKTWNKMYEKYLGIKVPNDKEGILQDVHWSDGMFGYFPTYALGSAYSAQFINKMEKDINIDKALEKGNFKIITDWLKNNIHKHASRYDSKTMIKMVTGKEFDPKHYVNYLTKKYKKLYNIK